MFQCTRNDGRKSQRRYYDLDAILQKQFLKAPLRFTHISSRFSLHRCIPCSALSGPIWGSITRAHGHARICAPTRHNVRGVTAFRNQVSYATARPARHPNGHLHAIRGGIHSGARVCQAI